MSYWLSKLLWVAVTALIQILFLIPIYISVIKERKRFYENILEGDRSPEEITITMPRYYSLVGTVAFVIFFGCLSFMYMQADGETNLAGIIICFVLSLNSMVCVFYAKNWALILKKDDITVYRPIFGAKSIKYNEITSVKENEEGIYGYIGKKCIFMVPYTSAGYQIIYIKLRNIGKLASSDEMKAFSVTNGKGDIIAGSVLIALAIGLVIFTPFNENNMPAYAFIAAFTICILFVTIKSARWKINISGNAVSVRTMFNHCIYELSDIVSVSDSTTALTVKFSDNRKLKVSEKCKNYCLFKELLRQRMLL